VSMSSPEEYTIPVTARGRSRLRRSPFVMRAALVTLAAIALLGAATYSWVEVVRALRNATPVHAAAGPPVPNGVVWNGRVFKDRITLTRYLRKHGRTYRGWAQAHPEAARLLAGKR
jgi:hypothetical protein